MIIYMMSKLMFIKKLMKRNPHLLVLINLSRNGHVISCLERHRGILIQHDQENKLNHLFVETVWLFK